MSQNGIHTANHPGRGAFVLFEGVDRCGKTTQSQRLVQHLKDKGVSSAPDVRIDLGGTNTDLLEIIYAFACTFSCPSNLYRVLVG